MNRSRVRFAVWGILALAIFVGLPGIAYYMVLRPIAVHHRWYRAIEYRILRLAERRPDNVDPQQWASCLHWTWNLHTNYGPPSYFDARACSPFLTEFDRRLKGKVDLSTIDWIWDQYAVHTRGGRRYSNNYRPTTAQRLKEASEDRFGEYNLDWWLEELRRRRSGGE